MLKNNDWLKRSSQLLRDVGIKSAKLDAELILADALNQERAWLLAHYDDEISPQLKARLQKNLQLRLNRVPLAYIFGKKEFYGRDFFVTKDTLIPRPETETIIEQVKKVAQSNSKVLDVGTGSGCIAITLNLELPDATVHGVDVSDKALKIAQKNAKHLKADVSFYKSDLLSKVSDKFDIITANLPYVATDWQTSPETKYEPSLALYTPQMGLELIFRLLQTASSHLTPGGYVILEADPRQFSQITEVTLANNLDVIKTEGFCMVLRSSKSLE